MISFVEQIRRRGSQMCLNNSRNSNYLVFPPFGLSVVNTLSSVCDVSVHRRRDLDDLHWPGVSLFLQRGSSPPISSFGPLPLLIFVLFFSFFLTIRSPTTRLTLCLHLFRCSQQQWPSSRLVRPRCQVSFFILPAVHSILQLSSLRSRRGKSAARRRKRAGEEEEEEGEEGRRKGRRKIIVYPVASRSVSHSGHADSSRQLVTFHEARPETHLWVEEGGRGASSCGRMLQSSGTSGEIDGGETAQCSAGMALWGPWEGLADWFYLMD